MRRARRLERFLTQPLFVTEAFTGHKGRHVPLEKTLAGCEAILAGKFDDVDEGRLYMIGAIEEVAAVSLELEILVPDGVAGAGAGRQPAGRRRQRPVRPAARPRGVPHPAGALRAVRIAKRTAANATRPPTAACCSWRRIACRSSRARR